MILYGLALVKKSINVNVGAFQQTMSLKYADGMVGVMPVFESKEAALEYASTLDYYTTVFEVEIDKENEEGGVEH